MTCKNCEKREIGCHSWCEEYNDYRKLNEEIKRLKHKEIEFNSRQIERTFEAKYKSTERVRKSRIKKKMSYVGRV